ncbi:MAG: Wzz/FepE/Etk N-terminal domain-containing protein [Pseudomonadota bacterium]|nr:Wzz/FepE/Etk N-terminal domain-containing protein [Pseudomonadota bacterium]
MTPQVFLELVKRAWRQCLAGAVLGALCGFGVSQLQTPKYQAEAILAPAATQGSSGGLSSLIGGLGGMASLALGGINGEGGTPQRAVTVLRSRAFVEKFVQSHGLEQALDTPGRVGTLLGIKPGPLEDRLYRTARRFRNDVQAIRMDPKTSFVTIAVKWRDPKLSAEWANALADAVNAEMRVRAIADADRALQYLQKELRTQTALEVRLAINELIESQLRNKMLANTQPEFVYTVLEPAMPPHIDDYVTPNPPLMAAACGVLGSTIGLLLYAWFRRDRRAAGATAVSVE